MAGKSNIEWTDATWNPVTGCAKVSQGCKNCYAKKLWPRLSYTGNKSMARPSGPYAGRKFEDVACHPERLEIPLRWKKPRMVFVNSMSDLFHEAVPFEFIDRVFAVMALAPQHTFQILTKRAERMREYLGDPGRLTRIAQIVSKTDATASMKMDWPLPNVWLGVSAEDEDTYKGRVFHLAHTPAAVRFVSLEPLIADPGDLMLDGIFGGVIDWIICGGESGGNKKSPARPMHPDWARSVRDQCQAAGVSFFFKQWGAWAPQYYGTAEGEALLKLAEPSEPWIEHNGAKVNVKKVGKKKAGRLLDGREWNEMPVLSGAEGPERT